MNGQLSQTIPSLEEIEHICSLQDPVLRNLRITYSYHRLSRGLQMLLQDPNINWCTFATWASRQAGVTIRNEELPQLLREKWNENVTIDHPHLHARLGLLKSVEEELLSASLSEIIHLLKMTTIAEHIDQTVIDVSGSIARGNLKVFQELAPHFSRLISTFQDDSSFDLARHDAFLTEFAPGDAIEAGGQNLLRQAFSNYIHAIFETAAKKKAERILLANAQVGLHEQTRLQPEIENALSAPIKDTLGARIRMVVRAVVPGHNLEDHVDALFDPFLDAMTEFWRREATRHMMTLKLADELLDLGRGLVAKEGQSLYPSDLELLQEAEVIAFMAEYYTLWDPMRQDATPSSGTADWADLKERMDYIICLFRSRQHRSTLYVSPFSDEQILVIGEGRVPSGPL